MTSAGTMTTLVEFTGNGATNKGESPNTLVRGGGGDFYGTTSQGGVTGDGTVFKMTPAGVLTTLVEFEEKESRQKGYYPHGALVDNGHGAFLGVTFQGGKRNAGTIFKVDVKTGVLTTLVEFGKVGP